MKRWIKALPGILAVAIIFSMGMFFGPRIKDPHDAFLVGFFVCWSAMMCGNLGGLADQELDDARKLEWG